MSSFDWNEYGLSSIEAVALCIKNGVTPEQWAHDAMWQLVNELDWNIEAGQENAMTASIQESWDNFARGDETEWKALETYDEATRQIITHHFVQNSYDAAMRAFAAAMRNDDLSEIDRIHAASKNDPILAQLLQKYVDEPEIMVIDLAVWLENHQQ